MNRILLASLFLGACASDNNISRKPTTQTNIGPDIKVTPVALEYSQLRSGEEEVKEFVVENIGEVDLSVSGITIEGSQAFTVVGDTAFQLAPEETRSVNVVFTPMGLDNVAQAVVHSDDVDEPETLVQLTGFGSVPELTIDPPEYDFGTLFVPCADTLTLTLTNTGDDVLSVESIEHVSDGDYTLVDTNTLPLELVPGAYTTVDVTYTPNIIGAWDGWLEVGSTDPRGLVTATQTGAAEYAAILTEDYNIPQDPPVDILFAVDQSCSMDGDSQLLGSNFSAFINTIDSVTSGWQIGVTNVGVNGSPGGQAGCFNNGILSDTTPNYQSLFAQAVVEGEDSSGDYTYSEHLLQLVDIALSKTAPGQCNEGFLRPGALLHVILVSDEPDQSDGLWTTYLNNYEGFVNNDPSLLKVSGILATSFFCGEGAGGYTDVVSATGGLTLDICSNWSGSVADLGSASLQGIGRFELGQPADGQSVEVSLNGVPLLTGWHFDAQTNEVVFDTALEAGDAIHISYGVAVSCTP